MDRISELKLTYKVDGDAMYKLGVAYLRGDKVDKDIKTAIKCFEKAAKMSNANACKQLADIYKSGSNGLKKDVTKAVKYEALAVEYKDYVLDEKTKSKIAATKVKNLVKYSKCGIGRSNECYKAGMMYFNGEGIPVDQKKALKCFFSAACANNMDAVAKMIECYENGYGCKVDKGYAEFWSNRLASLKQKEADKNKPKSKTTAKSSREVSSNNPFAEEDKKKPTVKETFTYTNTPLGRFNEKHTLYTCPSCNHDMLYITSGLEGDLFENYITIYNPGSILESVSDIMTRASREGETNKKLFRCSYCGLQAVKVENRKFDTRKDNSDFGNGKKLFTITYEVPSDMPTRYKQVIKRYEGQFKED